MDLGVQFNADFQRCFQMRLYLGIALVLLPNIAFAESDKDNISYVCDHDNVIEIITSQDDPDRIILNAFGRERTLKRNTSASQNSFVGRVMRFHSQQASRRSPLRPTAQH